MTAATSSQDSQTVSAVVTADATSEDAPVVVTSTGGGVKVTPFAAAKVILIWAWVAVIVTSSPSAPSLRAWSSWGSSRRSASR